MVQVYSVELCEGQPVALMRGTVGRAIEAEGEERAMDGRPMQKGTQDKRVGYVNTGEGLISS